eukprot:CAMPEP_0113676492 /NCGR_PEP_ID=MMETSP0038_2-20120614/8672_1 /TAXON_ID=2898 /ORGANISM="Cryptomonas paramecium" /LENGTH=111 /DNA_ID=CAMNT_0000593525 /DNA_START=260 /DNA_END=596 /DNA_ORIENTATION=+ /assembly_acc=CAM_ASM_000170
MNILVVNALIWSQWLQSSPSCRRSAAPSTPSEAPRALRSLILRRVRYAGATAPPRTATSYPYLASRSSQIKDNETHIQSLHEEAVKAALQVMAEWFVLVRAAASGRPTLFQ